MGLRFRVQIQMYLGPYIPEISDSVSALHNFKHHVQVPMNLHKKDIKTLAGWCFPVPSYAYLSFLNLLAIFEANVVQILSSHDAVLGGT